MILDQVLQWIIALIVTSDSFCILHAAYTTWCILRTFKTDRLLELTPEGAYAPLLLLYRVILRGIFVSALPHHHHVTPSHCVTSTTLNEFHSSWRDDPRKKPKQENLEIAYFCPHYWILMMSLHNQLTKWFAFELSSSKSKSNLFVPI